MRALRAAVTFDARLARRTLLHAPRHPVRPGDASSASVGEAGPVAGALRKAGHRVTVAARKLLRLEADLVINLCDTLGAQRRLAPCVKAAAQAGLAYEAFVASVLDGARRRARHG